MALQAIGMEHFIVNSDQFMCSICLMCCDGTVTVCGEGHVFCKVCIDKVMEKRGAKCPVCREVIIRVVRNRALDESIRSAAVQCHPGNPLPKHHANHETQVRTAEEKTNSWAAERDW